MGCVKVLVIEDNPMNMELALDLLRIRGHEVLTARTAYEAMRLLQEVTPDVILMDLQLPGVNGFELTRTLKAEPTTMRIPVIAISAYAMKGDDRKALQAGCDGYIPKPFDIDQFFQVVENALRCPRRAADPPPRPHLRELG